MKHFNRITIFKDTSPDGTLDPVYSIWMAGIPCTISQKSGGEVYRGQQLQAETTNVIELWFIAGIKPNMIAEDKNGNRYLFKRCNNLFNVRRELMIEATEVVV